MLFPSPSLPLSPSLQGVMHFTKEIPSIQPVSTMQFSTLHADYATIQKQLDQAEGEVAYAPPQADLGRFIQGARAKVDKLGADLEAMGWALEETCAYFGENPATCVPEEPFRALVTFSTAFANAVRDNERMEQSKKEMAIRKAEAQKRKGALFAQRKAEKEAAAARGGAAKLAE